VIGGNALPKDDEPDVTRFRSAAAKRVQPHRARARMGLRCLTVRVTATCAARSATCPRTSGCQLLGLRLAR
jgi:hypothetical protein